jgi:hypothetical protein
MSVGFQIPLPGYAGVGILKVGAFWGDVEEVPQCSVASGGSVPRGLKPDPVESFIGTTEVVPFHKT